MKKPRNHREDMALNKHNMHKSRLIGYNDTGIKIFLTKNQIFKSFNPITNNQTHFKPPFT